MAKEMGLLGAIAGAAALFGATQADASQASDPKLDAAMTRLRDAVPAIEQVRSGAVQRGPWLVPGGAALLPAKAVAASRDEDELSALLLFTLAYAQERPVRPTYVSGAARAASALIGGYADDVAEERERNDPYLRLPTPAHLQGDYPSFTPQRRPAAPRALALAASAGIAECRSVALLRRLARIEDPVVRDGARRALKDLGTLAYAPAGDCGRASE